MFGLRHKMVVGVAAGAFLVCSIGATASLQDTQRRMSLSQELLKDLLNNGAVSHVPLELRVTGTSGLGVFTRAPVPSGKPLFFLPDAALLTLLRGDHDLNELDPDVTDKSGLIAVLSVALAREKRQPSSLDMSRYVTSLPPTCDGNFATLSETELDLLETSASHSKVGPVRAQLQLLAEKIPDATKEEHRWAACTVMSRAFLHDSLGVAMMPFADLLNHGDACSRDYDKAARGTYVVARRTLTIGDEVTWPYLSEVRSSQDFVSYFGFAPAGVPRVTFSFSSPLPPHDPGWLQQHGCAQDAVTQMIPLRVPVSEETMQAGIRCLRLRLHKPEQASAVLQTGYIDAPWSVSGPRPHGRPAWIAEDFHVVSAVLSACTEYQHLEVREKQSGLLPKVAPQVRAQVLAENDALEECVRILSPVREGLAARHRAWHSGNR